MSIRRYLTFFFTLFLINASLFGQPVHLNSHDVRKVMDQLMNYHIEKKQVDPIVINRSLKIYIRQFDPGKAYLLADEITPYLDPSERLLQIMVQEYKKDLFTTFFALNALFQKSIHRAREWRQEWEAYPVKLVQEAKEFKLNFSDDQPLPKQLSELRQRHYHQLIAIIYVQGMQLGWNSVEGKEDKLVELCEKHLRHTENGYLEQDEVGKPFSEKEKDHFVLLKVLKSLAHSLDAHTAYYSPEEAFAMRVQLEKGMCGIGVLLHEGLEGVVVSEVIKGGPAEKIGIIKVGDTIVEVDGLSIRELSFHKVLEALRGSEGSKMSLGILRNSQKDNYEYLQVELTREKMALDDKRVDVSSEPFGDGHIGKITLHSFYEGEDGISSEKDIRKAIDDLRSQGPLRGLIFDMRENSGGFLSQAVKVGSLFIKSGVIVVSKYSDGSLKYYRALDGEKFYDGPLIVLVSRGSASAAEIVAQTLQDYGVAIVVGDCQTYGKGTIQHQTVTSDRTNSYFKVTVGKYYTVSGKSTQIEGVKADIIVPTVLNFEKFGEAYLDFPLSSDSIEPAFNDPLTDVDFYAKKWFVKYYLPNLQMPEMHWKENISLLKENSRLRLEKNQNFQIFLKKIISSSNRKEDSYGSNDLQMEEAVNIVKDMIAIEQ